MARTAEEVLYPANERAFAALMLAVRRLMAQIEEEGTTSTVTAILHMPDGKAGREFILRRQNEEKVEIPCNGRTH